MSDLARDNLENKNDVISTGTLKHYVGFSLDNWIAFDFEWVSTKQKKDVCKKPLTPKYEKQTSGTSTTSIETMEEIVTFGYEDSNGNKGVVDITDYHTSTDPIRELQFAIKEKLLKYRYCFGWGSKSIKTRNKQLGRWEGINGDLAVLDANFRRHNVQSIVSYDKFTGTPYIAKKMATKTVDIDLLKVFAKPLVKNVIFKNRYKTLALQEVSIALLGYGKLGNKLGGNLEIMSIEERKSYCNYDAHLVTELIKIENGNILKIMKVIADHTGLRLEEVCHKGMTGIWAKIMNDAISKKAALVGLTNIPNILRKLYFKTYSQSVQAFDNEEEGLDNLESNSEEDDNGGDESDDPLEFDFVNSRNYCYNQKPLQRIAAKDNNALKYKGGVVLEPNRGLHTAVHVFDVTSLYPTMIIKYDLSPETVNCTCCKNNPKKKVPSDIINDLVYALKEGDYWICQRRQGLFPKLLQQLTEQRIKCKNSGQELESLAIKSIINSGYGVFGHPYFKYYDPRVAELVTAYGRNTLLTMKNISANLGFEVLYGDTDSLFVKNLARPKDATAFIQECKNKLDIEVTHERLFSKLILVGKKHYVGIPSESNKESVIKGMEGIKSDRPKFIQLAFMQVVNDIRNDINPIPKLKLAVEDLNHRRVPADMLEMSLVLKKNPQEYANDCKQRTLGTKLGLRKGDILIYYKSYVEESIHNTNSEPLRTTKVVSDSDNPDDISYFKYKEMLLKSVKDILEILGYDVERELLNNHKLKLNDSVYFSKKEDYHII